MKKKIFSTLLLVAFALASTSMFVSCKDYDDDVKANTSAINDLRETVDKLQKAFDDAKAQAAVCKAQCDQNKADIEALQAYVKNLVTAEALESALNAAKEELANMIEGKVDKSELDALATRIAAIEEALAEALKDKGWATINYVDAADQNLQMQIDALNKFRDALFEYLGVTDEDAAIAKVKDLVESVKAAMQKIGSFPADDLSEEEVAKLREIMQNLDDKINAINLRIDNLNTSVETTLEQINVLQVLLDKRLNSMVNLPDFMAGGIESIEAPALYYQPVLSLVKSTDPATEKDGWNEQFHYLGLDGAVMDPNVAYNVYDSKENKKWLFDSGEMAPSMAITTHTWAGFVGLYGEGSEGSILAAYKDLTREFTRIKHAQWVPWHIARYHINPSTAKLDGTTFKFYTDTRIVVEEVESRQGNDYFVVPKNANYDGVDNKVEGGILSVKFRVGAWENYVHQLARTADGNYVKHPWAAKDDKDAAEMASLTDSINFVALQATSKGVNGEDRVVTSEYAAVVPSLVHVNALADHSPERGLMINNYKNLDKLPNCNNFLGWTGRNGNGGHVWKTAKEAIDHAPTHSIPFNQETDIAQFIEPHVTHITTYANWAYYDKTMDKKLFEEMGMKLRFYPVHWKSGSNVTSETFHTTGPNSRGLVEDASADYNTRYFIQPNSVKAVGNGYEHKTGLASREVIDRQPLYRIELWAPTPDSERGHGTAEDKNYNVIEVGYMKLVIRDNTPDEFANVTINDPFYLNCQDTQGITWAQVEDSILSQISFMKAQGYTKKQFENEYDLMCYQPTAKVRTLDGVNYSEGWAVQYDYTTEMQLIDGKQTPFTRLAESTDTIGRIWIKSDSQDLQTSVLKWSIAENLTAVAKEITGPFKKVGSVIVENDAAANAKVLVSRDVYKNMSSAERATVEPISSLEARAALLANKGHGYKGHNISRVVSFYKRAIGLSMGTTNVNVNLIIPGENVHFAYGEMNKKKDLGHWYHLNSWESAGSNGQNAYEVHMNVPTESWLKNDEGTLRENMDGSINAQAKLFLDNTDFWRNAFENYTFDKSRDCNNKNCKNGMPNMIDVLNPEHFDLYAEADGFYKGQPEFRFILPNRYNSEFSEAELKTIQATGEWKVNGYSGRHAEMNPDAVTEYTLHIDNNGLTIRDNCPVHEMTTATESHPAEDGIGHIIAEIVPYNRCREVVLYHNNDCADDILNYAGRYNDNGVDVRTSDYFVHKKMFTAYAEVITKIQDVFDSYPNVGTEITKDPCYPILLKDRYINFKFIRPISVWPIYKLVRDGINTETSDNTMDVLDMITIVDWRNYNITRQPIETPSNVEFDYKYKEYNGLTSEKDADTKEKTWPVKLSGKSNYEWMGVRQVYIDWENVLTDHNLTDKEREDNHNLIFNDARGKVQIAGKDVYSQEWLREIIQNKTLNYELGVNVPGFTQSFDTQRAQQFREPKNKKDVHPAMRQTQLNLRNNKDNVQMYHYFIPIYVSYAYGEYGKEWGHDYNKPATLKVWTVLTCVNTKNNPSAE